MPTAIPACTTRARYCSSVSATAPEVPTLGFAHVSVTSLGGCVIKFVTVFVGTAQDPGIVAWQNSGWETPDEAVTPPSWTTYW